MSQRFSPRLYRMTVSGMKMLKKWCHNRYFPRAKRLLHLDFIFPKCEALLVVIMYGLTHSRIARFSVILAYTGRMSADES